ncbi:hypothetical protein NQ176_g4544 [Zarea fungicola]|uniref:Uncharacterized protein n=1 Tax=Zarea fungicola TaxID=93591 RepID=A0ACC1NEU6_9HYPO|nr:hypothetical protein NQ176_g4544 [Lecanicillium fungicola]
MCPLIQVKCDETAPKCDRCVERGIDCSGYTFNLRWASKNQLKPPSQAKISQGASDKSNSTKNRRLASHGRRRSPSRSEPDTAESVLSRTCDSEAGTAGLLDSCIAESLDSSCGAIPLPEEWEHTAFMNNFFLDSVSPSLRQPSEQLCAPSDGLLWDLTDAPQSQSHTDLNGDLPSHLILQHVLDCGDFDQLGEEGEVSCVMDDVSTPVLLHNTELSRTRELRDPSSALCQHFFKEVISLYCTWDDRNNSMRVLIGRVWQSSGALYHAIQSMSAACLANTFPEFRAVAKREHSLALNSLRERPGVKEEEMMASFLIGHTSSWIEPNDLATERYETAVAVLKSWARESPDLPVLGFYGDAMDYWGMLLSFLGGIKGHGELSKCGEYLGGAADANRTKRVIPHPFIGICSGTCRILRDAGTLVYRYRKRLLEARFISQRDLDFLRDCIRDARFIERRLLAHTLPETTDILTTEDCGTSKMDLIHVDEAYRCTGLLQLYRFFPDILDERYCSWEECDLLHPKPPSKSPSKTERDAWLRGLALHTIDILRKVPFESSTRCIQPFILIAASCELKKDQPICAPCDDHIPYLDQSCLDVARAREFIHSRLSAYAHVLPLPKVSMFKEIVTNIWRVLDSGEDVHWVDVCKRMSFETMMG